MTVLGVRGLSVAWAAADPIFDEVTFTLTPGFYGLVGANGAGKTTLLSVLAGERAPTSGAVTRSPKGAVIAYCRQVVDRRDDDVDALAVREDGLAAELRGRLGLCPEELSRWGTLSPGERKRWQIGAALAREPEVLLLDEPTNHLDSAARKSLQSALRRFSGIGVVVSHDRAVLDALTTATLRIHERAVTLWPGRFSDASSLWAEARALEEASHDAARDRVRKAKAELDVARRTQAAAAKGISAGRRMKDKNDSDARGVMASTKAAWAAAKAGRVAASARTELDRAERSVPTVRRDATLGGRIFADYERAPNAVLFHVSAGTLGPADVVVLRDVRVTIGRQDRVRLEGPNGSGKTTLLGALIASTPRPERVLYLPQELSTEAKAQALSRLRSAEADARGKWLSIVAALGTEPERVLSGQAELLSPGEARKLVLAEALQSQVWGLVLDEPTNHLDLPSIERLEAALAGFPGAIVLVTHDDAFAAHVTSSSLRIERGTVR